jgi:thioredoxin 1
MGKSRAPWTNNHTSGHNHTKIMNSLITVTKDNFKAEVLESRQPVLVDFWAEWCGPCKMLAPVLEEIAVENAGRIKIAKVNVDENPELAERHHVSSIPTLIYYYNGLIHDQVVGVAGKRAITHRLEALTTKRRNEDVPTEDEI